MFAVLAACTSPPEAMPSSAPGTVQVHSDLRFAIDAPDIAPWTDPVLDAYAPEGGSGLPLVVLLPAHALTKDSSATYEQIATAVAERGAVVVVANWSQREDPPASFIDPEVLHALADLDRSVAACAVSYAVAHAADYGADPSRLVIGGELYGANIASLIALAPADPYPSCIVDASWQVRGLFGLDGDWLAAMPAFDAVAAAAVEALTPWPLLPSAAPDRAVLAVAESAVAATRRCEGPDAAWLSSRDPDGSIRPRLREAGVDGGGCLDLGDAARGLAAAMGGAGIPTVVVDADNADRGTQVDPGGHLGRLGSTDLALLTDAILALAGPSADG